MSFTWFADKPLRTREQVASEIHEVAGRRGLDVFATVLACMCVSVEVGTGVGADRKWWCPANNKVPGSANFPHDSLSDDNRSMGYFQQQPGPSGEAWWGTTASMMTLESAADSFFDRLSDSYMSARDDPASAGRFIQAVQRSAFPDRYAEKWEEAWDVVRRAGLGNMRVEPVKVVKPWRGDPVWLPEVLREAGLRCDIYPGAMERGHGDFGEIWGVVAHHTGSNPPSDNPGYIAKHPTLGLASQLHLNRSGKYTLCGVGVAWHAGNGSWPGIANNNANAVTIGIEAENNGTEGWSAAQYDAYVRGVAAILSRLGHDSSRVIGHKEWAGASQGKWDPGGIDMDDFRADVQKHIGSVVVGDDMFTDADRALLREIAEVRRPSRSPLRHLGEGPVDTCAGFAWAADGLTHPQFVAMAANYGHEPSIRLLAEVAAADPAKFPDRQDDAKLARAILEEVAAKNPQVLMNYLGQR